MAKKPNILEDIIVDEVSFVKKGANKKKFLLKKADEPSNDNKNEDKLEEISMKEEILKAATEVELDNSNDITEAVTKAEISQEGAEAITTVLQILKATAEDLPVEFYPELVTLAGGTLPVTEVEVEKIVEVEKKTEEEKTEDLKKEALEALTKEQREVLEEALAISKAAEVTANEAKAALAKSEDLALTKEFITKAEKEFAALPEKADVVGAILKKASVTFEKTEYESIERILKAANDAIASRPDFEATGTIGDGQAADAYGRVLAAAEELRKSNPDMSLAKAIGTAAKSDDVLYADYRGEVN